MSETHILAVVRNERTTDYEQEFARPDWFHAHCLSDLAQTTTYLENHEVQVLVLDQAIDGAFTQIESIRVKFPHIFIILVDEDADFALPGAADDITTAPFKDGELLRRIRRLLANRQMDTLRADAMPPVRDLNKRLRKAVGEQAKAQAALGACLDLGYIYAALYRLELRDPVQVNLIAQDGSPEAQKFAPQQADETQAVGWVAKTGQSRVLHRDDLPGHPLISSGHFNAAAVVPVGVANRYGTLFAAKANGDAVQQQDLLMLELIAAQLASTLAKEP